MPPVTRPRATSSVKVLRAVVAAVARAGGDAAGFLAAVGVGPEVVDDEHGRMPFELLERAWELAPAWAHDDDFGLHLAERATMGDFDVLDYAARSCSTIADALHWLARYQRLLHDTVVVTLDERPTETRVIHRVDGFPAGVPRHAAEAAVASWVVRARLLGGADVRPLRVQFRHPAPRAVREHERLFGGPIEFGCETNVLTLSAADVALPIATSDSGLRAILDRHADALLARLPQVGLLPEARAALADAIAAGTPTLAAVARRLRTSTRTLQRRLAEEGVRFEELLDHLRRDLAMHHLADPRLSVAEVGFLLGYADPTAFHRAFRRWTDQTPQSYRRGRPRAPARPPTS